MIQRARMTWAIRTLDSFSSSSSSVVGASVEIYFSLEKSISTPQQGSFHAYRPKNGKNSTILYGKASVTLTRLALNRLTFGPCIADRRLETGELSLSTCTRMWLFPREMQCMVICRSECPVAFMMAMGIGTFFPGERRNHAVQGN
jgi:hypothetical protein